MRLQLLMHSFTMWTDASGTLRIYFMDDFGDLVPFNDATRFSLADDPDL